MTKPNREMKEKHNSTTQNTRAAVTVSVSHTHTLTHSFTPANRTHRHTPQPYTFCQPLVKLFIRVLLASGQRGTSSSSVFGYSTVNNRCILSSARSSARMCECVVMVNKCVCALCRHSNTHTNHHDTFHLNIMNAARAPALNV